MKTKILFLVVAVLVSLMNSFVVAENEFNNTKYDEAGRPIEVETYSQSLISDNLVPEKKTCFSYDIGGNCLEKVCYTWDSHVKEWSESKKIECTYNREGKMLSMITSKWNDRKENWEIDSKLTYEYDKNGAPIVTKK